MTGGGGDGGVVVVVVVAVGVGRGSVSDSVYNHKPRRDSQSAAGSGTELSPRWESTPLTLHREGVGRRVNIGAV